MAQRSPATPAPPPAPRPTVVLRAGPPPKTGRKDLVIGVVGLLLLLSTVGMAVALPHHDVLPQQFKVAWPDTTVDLVTQSYNLTFGTKDQSHDFTYQVPVDDVDLITVKYEFKDDVPSSLPDSFQLQLYDPGGNAVGPPVTATNAPAEQGDIVGGPQANFTIRYAAVLFVGQFTVSLPKPSDDIVEVADQHLTADQLGQQLEAKAHLATKGEWKVRVSLLAAGGCPNPTDKESANRAAACRSELQANKASQQDIAAGNDPGNPFTVEVFSYGFFAPDIQKLG